ncbi:gas vesicle protein G [Prescottella agglutinans]|uniref:Gas vesicle protein G n=1 Tax=Prescottella agglutinans TaxID=1644129 RepID=A0A3S3ANP9_9NOCA|nr:gas vesicle protein GvpG [Prescottella agglutinans]RVW09158.1 gas vesicle protein G [Prescottella agglutinans]
MGIFSAVLGLPLAPVRGVVWLGDIVRRQVEEELYSPAALRRQLDDIDNARASGQISEEEAARAEEQVVARMTGRETSGGTE